MAKSAEGSRQSTTRGGDGPEGGSAGGGGSRGRPRLRVVVIRHAIAEDRAAFGKTGEPDALRPLTKQGRRRMRRAAQGLRRIVPKLNVLAASPLARADETAEIVAERFDRMRTATVPGLAPGKPAGALMGWLQDQRPGAVVAVVGHEPHLGQFVSWALTGLRESFVPLKKGAACMLEFPDEIKPGRARLVWFLKPSQLRAMA